MDLRVPMNGGWEFIKRNLWQIVVVIMAAGALAYQVNANTNELNLRRANIEKIPTLERAVVRIEKNQKKILCRLGDTISCNGD